MEDILSYTSLNKNRINKICQEVNNLENKYSNLSDYELSSMTEKFRYSLRRGSTIEEIMPDALAVCREAIRRKLGVRPYDTQIIAAAAMNDNIIAEMQTGEGKTLVQILSSYLYALEATKDEDKSKWGSVHILTANEYLAQRDKMQNESVFNLLNLSCGYAEDKSKSNNPNYRRNKVNSYKCDIVYATARTVAFDYLDDNQVKDKNARFINRELYHAIVDEADDILLDQAKTPLVLSGTMPGIDINTNDKLIKWACNFVYGVEGHRNSKVTCKIFDKFNRDKSKRYFEDAVIFRDTGRIFLSEKLYKELYGGKQTFNNISLQEEYFNKEYAVTNAILAEYFYLKDKQYTLLEIGNAVDKDGKMKKVYEVALISETSGRILPKTKYRDGIQEAIEAKEEYLAGGKYIIKKSSKNIERSTITFPSFVKLYKTGISGMTGTSDIEEFKDIYGLETYIVPTRKPSIRKDEETELYSTKKNKYLAILKDIVKHHSIGQPILVGTISVKESNEICRYLDSNSIKYQRLDAVNSDNEAKKIEQAGQKGMITIATNMAGRGTDIKLGKGVEELGGLYVIGTSKNNNSRIDRQLMGRCARQGLPGSTKYYQSLEDDLIALRYGDYRLNAIKKFYANDREKIESKKIKKLVDNCQKVEEGISKQIRISTNEVETRVIDVHRNKIFEQRNKLLEASQKEVLDIIYNIIGEYAIYLCNHPNELFKINHLIDVKSCYDRDDKTFANNVMIALFVRFKESKGMYEPSKYVEYLRGRIIDIIDSYWISHLTTLEELRKTILNTANLETETIDDFEREANKLFIAMNEDIKNEIITYSIIPNMPFGSYVIKSSIDDEEVKML